MCAVDDWRPPKDTTNFAIFFFLPEIRWRKRCNGNLLYYLRPALRLFQIYPNDASDFWLVVASPHPAEAIETQAPVSIHRPNQRVNVLTTRSTRWHLLSNSPPHRKHHRSFDCCVNPTSGGHPRPVLRPSLNYSMGAISAPQTRGSNAARASPNAGGLQKTHREPRRCDSGPWRLLPWRGRAKPLGVEQKIICELDLLR